MAAWQAAREVRMARGAGGPTARQLTVLDFIQRHSRRTGAPPTVREIASALGFASTNAVACHVDALERHGLLERRPHSSRGLRASEGARGGIPILGRIAAGTPITAVENLEGYLTPDPFLVGDGEDTFVLRVQGDSMTGDGILPGDYIIVHRQPVAERGRIVVAMVDDEATVKHWQADEDAVRLLASNPAYPPIEIRPGDGRQVEVLGVVTGVFRKV